MKTRGLVEIAVTSFGLLTAAACATGSAPVGSGNGGDGGDEWVGASSSKAASSSSSGDGGAGGAGGAGSSSNGAGGASTSSSSTSSSSASSSSSGMCAEMPCQLVSPQCGCGANEMCAIDGTPAGTRVCVPAGTVALGGLCTGSNCAPGGLCAGTSGSASTCKKYCANDSNCTAPGGLCVIKVTDGSSGQIPNVTLCSENCDPLTGVGCSAAGTSCQVKKESMGLMRAYTQCTGAGTGMQNALCAKDADCASGFGCFNTGTTQCLKYCKIGGAACPGSTTCNKVGTIGSTEYGVCL